MNQKFFSLIVAVLILLPTIIYSQEVLFNENGDFKPCSTFNDSEEKCGSALLVNDKTKCKDNASSAIDRACKEYKKLLDSLGGYNVFQVVESLKKLKACTYLVEGENKKCVLKDPSSWPVIGVHKDTNAYPVQTANVSAGSLKIELVSLFKKDAKSNPPYYIISPDVLESINSNSVREVSLTDFVSNPEVNTEAIAAAGVGVNSPRVLAIEADNKTFVYNLDRLTFTPYKKKVLNQKLVPDFNAKPVQASFARTAEFCNDVNEKFEINTDFLNAVALNGGEFFSSENLSLNSGKKAPKSEIQLLSLVDSCPNIFGKQVKRAAEGASSLLSEKSPVIDLNKVPLLYRANISTSTKPFDNNESIRLLNTVNFGVKLAKAFTESYANLPTKNEKATTEVKKEEATTEEAKKGFFGKLWSGTKKGAAWLGDNPEAIIGLGTLGLGIWQFSDQIKRWEEEMEQKKREFEEGQCYPYKAESELHKGVKLPAGAADKFASMTEGAVVKDNSDGTKTVQKDGMVIPLYIGGQTMPLTPYELCRLQASGALNYMDPCGMLISNKAPAEAVNACYGVMMRSGKGSVGYPGGGATASSTPAATPEEKKKEEEEKKDPKKDAAAAGAAAAGATPSGTKDTPQEKQRRGFESLYRAYPGRVDSQGGASSDYRGGYYPSERGADPATTQRKSSALGAGTGQQGSSMQRQFESHTGTARDKMVQPSRSK